MRKHPVVVECGMYRLIFYNCISIIPHTCLDYISAPYTSLYLDISFLDKSYHADKKKDWCCNPKLSSEESMSNYPPVTLPSSPYL